MRLLILFWLLVGYTPFIFSQQGNELTLTRQLDTALFRVFSDNDHGGAVFIKKDNKILYNKSFGLADLKTKGW